MKKYIISVFFFFVSIVVKSQDFVYSNYLMSPIYLNPALAGISNKNYRLVINYRNQYPGIKNAYKYGSVSFDKYEDKLNGSYSINLDNSKEGAGFYNKTNFGLSYSFQGIGKKVGIHSRNDFLMSLSFKFNYFIRSIDYDKLIFYDQIDIENGVVSGLQSEASYPVYNNKGFADFSVGIAFVYNNFIGGFAAHHLSEPNESLISSESLLKRKYNLHLSYYNKFGKNRNSGKMLTYSLNMYYQDVLPVIMLGYQFKYNFFTVGQYLRSATSVDGGNTIVLAFILDDLLYQKREEDISLGLSYDLNFLGMGTRNTAGALEINIIYQSGRLKTKRRKIPCPTNF